MSKKEENEKSVECQDLSQFMKNIILGVLWLKTTQSGNKSSLTTADGVRAEHMKSVTWLQKYENIMKVIILYIIYYKEWTNYNRKSLLVSSHICCQILQPCVFGIICITAMEKHSQPL